MIEVMTKEGCRHVCENMRDTDRRAIFSLRYTDDMNDFIEGRWETRGTAWEGRRDGKPVAIGGVCPASPKSAVLWFIGTNEWKGVMVEATRFLKRTLLPTLLLAEFHRVEAFVLASDERALHYAARLGMRQEGLMRSLGKNREDFARMAMVKP